MIIFLHGDDTYRSREKLRELKEKFLHDVDPSGTNLVTIDGATASASDVWGAIAAQSFLVRKRMVVVERIGSQKSDSVRSEIADFFERIPEDVIVVFWEEKGRGPSSERRVRPTKKTKKGAGATTKRGDPLFPALLQRANHVQEFAPLEGVALTRWVRDQVKARDGSIAPDATRELVSVVGPDCWRMRNEIEKLTLAAAGAPITVAMVRDLVAAASPEDIFGFVDAIGRGDRAAAVRILRELESSRADPLRLLGMIHRQLRLLVMAADLLDRGVPASQLAAELGVHPFVAQKIAQQARTSPLAVLRALYPRLLDLDRRMKSSRAPWGALMELFILDAAR